MNRIINDIVRKLKYIQMRFKKRFSFVGSSANYMAINTDSILVTTSSGTTYAMEVAR